MKRLLVILIGALLLALALAGGTVVFLAASDGGTRFLAQQAERFLPIRFEGVSGALLREIHIERVNVELEGRSLRIDGLAARVALWPLVFENRLEVAEASAAAVVLGAAPADQPAGAPPALELPFLPLVVDVATATVASLELPDLFTMRIDGSLRWDRRGLNVRRLAITSEALALALRGQLGTGGNPPLTAEVRWSLPGTDWRGQGQLQGRVDELTVQHGLEGFVSAQAEGRASLADVTRPQVDLEVVLGDLQFGDTALTELRGHLSGTPANLAATVSSRLVTPPLEPFAVSVQAYGPPNGPLTLQNVTADALGGTEQAQGSVAWQDGVVVNLGGQLRGVSLAGWREEIRGAVDAAFQFDYRDERVSLVLDQLAGTLNGRPVDGAMTVTQVDGGWNVSPFRLRVGNNAADGELRWVEEHLDLSARLEAPTLEGLALGVAGDASGRLRLSGRWPDVSGEVTLNSARLAGLEAVTEGATIAANVDNGRIRGSIEARRLTRNQVEVDAPRLDVDGTVDDLGWRVSWRGGDAQGRLQREGETTRIALSGARLAVLGEDWRLNDATQVLLGTDRLEVSPACLAAVDASVCLDRFVMRDGRIDTRGRLDDAPLALLRPWLPLDLADPGYLEGRWNLAGPPTDLTGDLELAVRALALRPGAGDDPIALPDIEASGVLAAGALAWQLSASDTDSDFDLVGEGRLESLRADGALSGRITAAVADITPLKAFDQRIDRLEGAVNGQVLVSGTPAAPRFDGQVHLSDGRLKLTDPDLKIADVDLRLRLDQSGNYRLDGTARQNKAEVALTASGSGLFTDSPALRAHLAGDGLVARHPDWEITVTPDLDFVYDNGTGSLGGRVTVPKAEVRMTALPGSVPSPSQDVVVVGRDDGSRGPDNPFRMNVEVVLGEEVVLKALGISAELQGSLRARLGAQGRMSLRGSLDITGGVLSAQGQVLEIESGSVAYNGPIDRPYIDLRAVRRIDDASPPVKVGLHIRGDANNLTSSVFSEPAMSDTRALSFLVLGRDIEEDTESSDSGRLMAAAINLGLSQSKGITGELMRLTGLDELSASAEAQDDFAIVAGKRVTDDLYVRYTYNTLAAVGAFLVRYDLGERWQLEAESGEKSSMDLMYHIQK